MKGILIDKAEIEKFKEEYKKLNKQNITEQTQEERPEPLKIEFILEESES